jgi:hypothetical protein
MATRQLSRAASALAGRSLLGASRTKPFFNAAVRTYSAASLRELDGTQLAIKNTTSPKELLSPDKLVFGHTFTDHMLTAEWTASEGMFLAFKHYTRHDVDLLQDGIHHKSSLTKTSH